MAEEPLPHFRYHPDPVATRMLVPRAGFVCPVCQRSRAYAYVGPYSSDNWGFENGEEICPWCIADGSAARTLNATFAVTYAELPLEARTELEQRTPSFHCVQQERWLDHHDDAAAYIGEVDFERYLQLPPAAQLVVRHCSGDDPHAALRPTDFVQRAGRRRRTDGVSVPMPALRLVWWLSRIQHGRRSGRLEAQGRGASASRRTMAGLEISLTRD
jgi:uncharacterized protein